MLKNKLNFIKLTFDLNEMKSSDEKIKPKQKSEEDEDKSGWNELFTNTCIIGWVKGTIWIFSICFILITRLWEFLKSILTFKFDEKSKFKTISEKKFAKKKLYWRFWN